MGSSGRDTFLSSPQGSGGRLTTRQLQLTLLSTLLLSLVYGEMVTFVLHSMYWTKSDGLVRTEAELKQWHAIQLELRENAKLAPEHSINNIRYLIVSNPALQRESLDTSSSLDRLRVWDADRYLRKVFGLAVREYQPDVVVVLGDIMQDGATLSDQEFKLTVLRFRRVFHSQIPTVVVPGEADVVDPRYESPNLFPLRRFEEAFEAKVNQYYQLNYFTFATVDTLSLFGHSQLKEAAWPAMQFISSVHGRMMSLSTKHPNADPIPALMFCHYPAFALEGSLRRSIINELKPRYIFSSRNHEATAKSTHSYPSGAVEVTIPSFSPVDTALFESSGFAVAHVNERGVQVAFCATPSRRAVLVAYAAQVLALLLTVLYRLYESLVLRDAAAAAAALPRFSSRQRETPSAVLLKSTAGSTSVVARGIRWLRSAVSEKSKSRTM